MTLLALWLTTFGVCVLGAVVPVVNTEIYLLAVAALSPEEFVVPLVFAATAGQMTGKVGMYLLGRGVLQLKHEKLRVRVMDLREKLATRPWLARATLFSSATLGLPPLYIMSVAAGALGMGMLPFIAIGFVGRFIHFTVIALLPQYARYLFG